MKLRIGDLVTFEIESGLKRGFITSLTGHWIPTGYAEIYVKGQDLKTTIDRKEVTSVTPREKVKKYWRYL